jgi:hypothetical protein
MQIRLDSSLDAPTLTLLGNREGDRGHDRW